MCHLHSKTVTIQSEELMKVKNSAYFIHSTTQGTLPFTRSAHVCTWRAISQNRSQTFTQGLALEED
jgi:hypothetical protein